MLESINSVSRAPAVEKTLETIREKIILNKYECGEMLSENGLSKEYGVSRGSIRSALSKLENEGLIQTLSNGRKQVVGVSEKFIRDLYDTRTMIEIQASKILLEDSGVEFNYDPLIDSVGKFYSLHYSSQQELSINRSIINTNFHRTIVVISENRSLLQCWEVIEPMVLALAKFSYIANGDKIDDNNHIETHTTLLDKILKKDSTLLDEVYHHTQVAVNDSIESYKKIVKSAK